MSYSGQQSDFSEDKRVPFDTTGFFEGLSFRIDHRDTNSVLRLTLQHGYPVKAKPGCMLAMEPTVQVKGSMKFSFSKMVSGAEMAETLFTGPGEVIVAPDVWGDIVPIPIRLDETWNIRRDAFLACTQDVKRGTKTQGFMKGIMSGEGFFVTKVSGQGIIWVQSLGAIIRRDLVPGEEWIVDNGHLVAWSMAYSLERISTIGGLLSGINTREGMVCRFRGPGTVYIQTRNPHSLSQWITGQTGCLGGHHGSGPAQFIGMLGS